MDSNYVKPDNIKRILTLIFAAVLIICVVLFTFKFIPDIEKTDTTAQNAIDQFTDSDNLYDPISGRELSYTIQDYISYLYCENFTIIDGQIFKVTGDDPIVNIVPKEYFENTGENLIIGREYGYYIETVKKGNCNMSTVLVFDIITITDTKNPATPSQLTVTIKPLFEYVYYCAFENKNYEFYFEHIIAGNIGKYMLMCLRDMVL